MVQWCRRVGGCTIGGELRLVETRNDNGGGGGAMYRRCECEIDGMRALGAGGGGLEVLTVL